MEDIAFGKALRKMREDSGKTVTEISEYLTSLGHKAKTVTIYGWERGVSQPNPEIFLEMCKFYGVFDIFSYFEYEKFSKESDLSKDEQEHIKKYRSLDRYGKEAVDGVLDVEWKRCEAARVSIVREQKNQMEISEEITCFIVPYFLAPPSAGPGQEAGDGYEEDLILTKRPPRGTSYVVRVSGNSMEPTFYDGNKVFVRAQLDIGQGEIGIFFMNGQQWIKELGDGVLVSHNSEKYAPIPMTEDVRCQGLVLGVCDESYFA